MLYVPTGMIAASTLVLRWLKPLLSPLVAPQTTDAQRKHVKEDGQFRDSGFSQDGLYRVLTTAMKRLADEDTLDLNIEERNILQHAHPHSLRHTFGNSSRC